MLKEEYKHYTRVLQRVIRNAKNDFYNKQFKNAGKDTRKVWNIINEVIDKKNNVVISCPQHFSTKANPLIMILKLQMVLTVI